MQPHFELSDGVKIFMLALIDYEVVSKDESQLAERLQSTGLKSKDLRTIMDFAVNCGYLEPLGEQLMFTKKARDRVRHFRSCTREL